MTVVGNPIMHHLLLGLDPVELGGAPFALTIDAAYEVPARDLGISIAPGGYVYVLPCIAGHVGADTAGVVLSEGPYLKDELTLLVDVGTNAEIVLGNRERLLACSSPTGPAFEGAQISCGQRAAPGAIERIRIDRETLEPRYKVIGCDLWSDEPGFAEATASTGVTGICGSGIIEIIAEMWLAGHHHAGRRGRRFAGCPHAAHRGDGPNLLLPHPRRRAAARHHAERRARHPARQGGALCGHQAADGPLRRRQGRAHHARRRIRQPYRRDLRHGARPDPGLRPGQGRVGRQRCRHRGAHRASQRPRSRREIEQTVLRIEKIETALEPAFQEHFVSAMAIPNKTDPFPELSKVVAFPAPKAFDPGEEGGRRRRRRDG